MAAILPVLVGCVATSTALQVSDRITIADRWWKKNGCIRLRVLLHNTSGVYSIFKFLHKEGKTNKNISSYYSVEHKSENGVLRWEIPMDDFYLKDNKNRYFFVRPLFGHDKMLAGFDFWTYRWFYNRKSPKNYFDSMTKFIYETILVYEKKTS